MQLYCFSFRFQLLLAWTWRQLAFVAEDFLSFALRLCSGTTHLYFRFGGVFDGGQPGTDNQHIVKEPLEPYHFRAYPCPCWGMSPRGC